MSEWFFYGLKDAQFVPNEGIDKGEALRHLGYIMGSWEPQHEHKEAGCAYLLGRAEGALAEERLREQLRRLKDRLAELEKK